MDTKLSGIWHTRKKDVAVFRNNCFQKKIEIAENHRQCRKNTLKYADNKSVFDQIRSVFKNSSVSGLPQIASTRTWKRRIRKILIFLFCLVGFLYQTGSFLLFFWSYPTVTYVEDSQPDEIVLPALTFCSNNKIRRHVYCENRQGSSCKVFSDHDQFCDNYPLYCRPENEIYDKVPVKEDGFKISDPAPWDIVSKEAPTNEIIEFCDKITRNTTHKDIRKCSLRRFPIVLPGNTPTFCTTVESQINHPFSVDTIYPNTFEYLILLNTFPEDYFFAREEVLMYAAIHNRRHLVNPYREGIILKGGHTYKLFVSMREDITLPSPYATNCTDYLSLWDENNGTGPLNERECIEYCKLKKFQSLDLCIDEFTWYAPHLQKLCKDMERATLNYEMITDCSRQCKPACWYKDIGMHVSFQKFTLSRHMDKPKFNSIELFSYIGGYVGMWLGISLISVLDLLESLCSLLHYPFVRKKYPEIKRIEKI